MKDFHFLNFVRCAETVEEVKEWNPPFNCGKMRDGSEIHDFLDTPG